MDKPVLFCYDGSEGSKTALGAAVELIKPGDAVVLVVWTRGRGAVGPGRLVPGRDTKRRRDRRAGSGCREKIAEEGAAGARKRGYNASARIAQSNESVAKTIDEIAQEIDAGLIVCGQRGRGAIAGALFGSVSHALAAHTKRPVLIAPQHPS